MNANDLLETALKQMHDAAGKPIRVKVVSATRLLDWFDACGIKLPLNRLEIITALSLSRYARKVGRGWDVHYPVKVDSTAERPNIGLKMARVALARERTKYANLEKKFVELQAFVTEKIKQMELKIDDGRSTYHEVN